MNIILFGEDIETCLLFMYIQKYALDLVTFFSKDRQHCYKWENIKELK